MAKIFFSLSGEGRGHATRVRTLVEELRHRHEIIVFAPRDAYELLSPLYAGTEVQVRPLDGLLFYYTRRRRLDYPQTIWQTARYLARYPRLRRVMRGILAEERPDLVITDFEPALPRAARSLGIPFISITHQHFLLTYDLSSLPFWLRFHARYMGWLVRAYYTGQRHTIVSSFYFPPLRPGCHNVTQVGVLLRPSLRQLVTSREGHLVAYLRRFAAPRVLEVLSAAGRPVNVYGLGERPAQGHVTFCSIDEQQFIEDLASADALISTAGNQLVGEALYLGKPCLVLPEAGNYEQFMNAHFLQEAGGGAWAELERFTSGDLQRFLAGASELRWDRQRLDGLPDVLKVIHQFLETREAVDSPRPFLTPR